MDYITFIKFALDSEFAGVLYYVMEAVEIPFLSQGLIKQFGKIDLLPLFRQIKSRKFWVFDIFNFCFFWRNSLQSAMN